MVSLSVCEPNLCESMKRLRDSSIVQGIGDIMVSRFEDAAGEEFQEQVSHLCSQQSQALELIKNKCKDPLSRTLYRYKLECEASPHCRRLQLKDLLVSEMQRLTKSPCCWITSSDTQKACIETLTHNVLNHENTSVYTPHTTGSPDLQTLVRAQACCRGILRAVNGVVRETEHRRLLSRYQRRLDLSPLERQASPVAAQFKNLDLTTKKMIHEGPLTWKVSKDKAIDIHALLLSDLLVLLQRGSGDRLILRCPARSLGGVLGVGTRTSKPPFPPVVRLDSSLVRSVATDNKALYVISTSERQIYELVAGTSSEKNTWKNLLEKTISSASGGIEATEQGSTAPGFVGGQAKVADAAFQDEAASQKQKVTSLSSQQEGQEMPCQSPKGRSPLEMLRHETRPCQSRASIRQRMIKNVDGIFQRMEGLMKNLHQLR
ncbi:hypothetical protein P4O66_019955, partial [Electrophorus voltai]